jgi:hypothetical protein
MMKTIREKCFERCISIGKVDPKGASPKFPLYGSKLINGYAQKHLKCSKCKVEMGWDVVAVVNMRENI